MTFVSTGLAKCNLRHWARARLGGFTVPSCKQGLSVFLCICVNLSFINLDGCEKPKLAQQRSKPAPSQQAPTASSATPTADQLYSLVAPIALFPDNLLAQVLAGSTFPDQITAAWNYLQQNPGLKGPQLMQAVDGQSWDNSIKGLTQFPDVLLQMSGSLSGTTI